MCVYVCICMCVYVYVYVYIYIYICIYMYVCVYVCVCICMYIYIYIHTHTYIHTYTYTHIYIKSTLTNHIMKHYLSTLIGLGSTIRSVAAQSKKEGKLHILKQTNELIFKKLKSWHCIAATFLYPDIYTIHIYNNYSLCKLDKL